MTNSWANLIGHEQQRHWFQSALRVGRLAGSFLFVGADGIGKGTFAKLLTQTLLCETTDPQSMDACGVCEGCVQVAAETHPDLLRVCKPKDRSFIPLDLLIGRPEARMQEGFCRDIRLRPYRGRRKVAILQDADHLNEEGANCLLKTLEEPPSDAVVILIGTSEQRQLPTIRSRCRIIRFSSLTGNQAAKLLRDVHGIEATDREIDAAVEMAAGDMHVAARLLRGEAGKMREALLAQLDADYPDPVMINRVISKHVDEAGKDASIRRGAMRDVFSMAVQHYRQRMRRDAQASSVHPHTLARLDRSVRAIREVDRSANQATLIECYAADIASGTTGDRGEIG